MTAEHEISIEVNGHPHTATVEPRDLLVTLLRRDLGLTGTHVGCETSVCGACTVLLDGKPTKSCTVFAVQAAGHAVRTIEDVADGDSLHPVQQGFHERHGLQCGYCTPGMVMSALALLEEDEDPSTEAIRQAIDGNLCRCTGYQNIVRSIEYAAAVMRGDDSVPPEWEA